MQTNPPRGDAPQYDVIVVGGGAAGLSGALTLARALRSVLVIDGGEPRNRTAAQAHGYLTRDGVPPGELVDAGRAEVTRYGGRIVYGQVMGVERRADDTFRVVLEDGSDATAARLLVASGLVDELPSVPGLAERWGRDVLHCPYCHGWEVRDRAIGVLATGPLSVHQSLLWRQWSADVTLFQHDGPEPSDEEYEQLAARGIRIVTGRVASLEIAEDRLTGVRLDGGQVFRCEALAVASRMTARTDFLAGLGLEPAEMEMRGHVIGTYIPADPTGATDVPGVWVAGNVTDLPGQIVGAAAAGVKAGAMINADLVAAEARRAVAARTPQAASA